MVSSKRVCCALTGHLALCEALRILEDVRRSPCPWSSPCNMTEGAAQDSGDPRRPLWVMMSELNVEREANQVGNGVKALQAVATAYTKVQMQERACVWENSICWLKRQEQKGVSGTEAGEVGRGR